MSLPAHEAIIAAVIAIPRGQVASYGAVAARAGLPKRARLVARVLASLPPASGVPWQRVVRANGCIAFAADSADFQRQREALLAEGCQVAANGRVSMAKAPVSSLDAQLWGGFFAQS